MPADDIHHPSDMWVLKPGDLFGGRYRIEREIGTGGMAYVYAARDEELQETIALKIIRPELVADEELVERFKREVRIARQIHHPNIIRIYEFGRTIQEEKVFYYITMEFLTGVDLATWLPKRGPISLNEILEIALQLCDALDEAHRRGVIHRDIKPQNVFIDQNGRATLMDFGISRLATLPGLTSGSQLMGTPRYMSPEQVSGRQELDHRSDVYSLGVVLYELCTHRVPFSGQTPVEIALRHLQEVPKPPRTINAQIPVSLEKVILTCLQKAPDSRFQSAGALRSSLLNVAREAGVDTLFRPPSHVDEPRSQGAAPSVAAGEPASAAASREAAPPEVAGRRRVPGTIGLILLVGGLLLIGAAVIVTSLLILQSRGPEPVAVEDRLDPSGAESRPPPEVSERRESSESARANDRIGTGAVPVGETASPVTGGGDTASVHITANPGAEIYINGELAGVIPPVVTRRLSVGSHRIRYVIPGYDEREQNVEVTAGHSNDFSHHFPPYGLLRISAQPAARVLLDGRELGETPIDGMKVREGEYRLVVQRAGYRSVEQTIDVRFGRVNSFEFELIRR